MKSDETEARSRWGNTDAYREHEQKTNNYTKEKWAEANDGMMAIFAELLHARKVVQLLILPRRRRLSPSFRRTSRIITTPAPTRFSQGLARCTLPTSDSRRTSISTARALPSLHLIRLRFTAENEYKQIQSVS